MMKNRYVQTLDLYIYADSDEDAKKEAERLCAELNDKYDCHAETIRIYQKNYGDIGEARKIYPKGIKR